LSSVPSRSTSPGRRRGGVLVAGEEGHRATALGRADLKSCGWMGFGGARSRPRLVRRGSGGVEGDEGDEQRERSRQPWRRSGRPRG
jgi:hypothetical protein